MTEMLLCQDERNGLGYIYANFADDFKKKYKGKGHEASLPFLRLPIHKTTERLCESFQEDA